MLETVSFKAYQDYIISKVENNDDLVDGAKVETQTFNRNEQQLLKLDNSYKLNTSNVFDSNTKDYSISMLIQTSDKNSKIELYLFILLIRSCCKFTIYIHFYHSI